MKRLLLTIMIILLAWPFSVKATELLFADPAIVTVKENDLGRTYNIKIKNDSSQKLSLKASEILVNRDSSGKITPNEVEITDPALEFFVDEFEVEAGAEFEHKVRLKFLSQKTFSQYPAIKYISSGSTDGSVAVNYELIVPFLIQNREGEYKVDLSLKLAKEDITTSGTLEISGDLTNSGNKFFTPSGTIAVYRKDQLLFEEDITSQINGMVFPGETRTYNVTHDLKDQSFQAVGEYRVEVKIMNDIASGNKMVSINVLYIPTELIKVTGIALGATVLLFIIIAVIRNRRRPKTQSGY